MPCPHCGFDESDPEPQPLLAIINQPSASENPKLNTQHFELSTFED